MDDQMYAKMKSGNGFIAALDQSGGSTPKALKLYGIDESEYSGDAEMFDLMHQMRSRIITSPAFNGNRVLGAILFEMTMDRQIEGMGSAEFLWNEKNVVPFLKVDKGLAEEADGVQLMKPIPDLDTVLGKAKSHGVFGTKMRSVIKLADRRGVRAIVDQQFQIGQQIVDAGLVPIIEPEVDIRSPQKAEAELLLNEAIGERLGDLSDGHDVMLKLTIPTESNLYADFVSHPRIVRVVALSGGYSRDAANALLAANQGVIASFSRALTEGLSAQQSDEAFNETLDASIESIYRASIA